MSLWWKPTAAPRLPSRSPSRVAEEFWRRASRWESSHATLETFSRLRRWNRPTSRWAFRYRSRLWPALAGFRKCDQESGLSDRARGASIFVPIFSDEQCCASWNSRKAYWMRGFALVPKRQTNPAPPPGAATRPGILPFAMLCAWIQSRAAALLLVV